MTDRLYTPTRILCVALWVLATINVLPDGWLFDLDPDRALYVIAAACVLSYKWISRAHSRPAVELYLAGKDVGRREAMLEQECQNVQSITTAPRLTVVEGRRSGS